MTRPHSPMLALAGLVTVLTIATACGGSTGPLGPVPVPSVTAAPSVAQGSPDATPGATDSPSGSPIDQPSSTPTGSEAPSPSSSGSTGTTIVRAYFWLDGAPGSAGPVAVLREIPATKAVATAAVNALLAGPSDAEGKRSITSQIPDGTQLLGLTVENGLATIDLSSEFIAGGAGEAYQTRQAQIVYTLTQFPSIKAVGILIEGSGDSIALDRGDYADLLPDIWVDRPAWGAAIGNPAHVTGNADVFEAAFRISILDGSGATLADQQAMATCGTGCRGTFDVSIPYTVSKAQYGILRVYNPSAQDGTPESIRDYRVWLTPKA
ncbi:MAG TPA: Gmad2 immunoglobulin-like domain-containing protein [Candidatus Limnocylindrales bacterium]|nr:Gmad2 immunoglobulin-like domain-containing protein [Candidatus Limnocylindrales bacterium]